MAALSLGVGPHPSCFARASWYPLAVSTPDPPWSTPILIDAGSKDFMNIQDWLTQLLSQPAGDSLDWETYRVTMETATWKALWRDIDSSQGYEDGLEVGFRLLRATRQHRDRLSTRAYQTNQILLYRSILSMLDKADRWDTYLAAWEIIWAQASQDLTVKGDALAMSDSRLAPFMRQADGGHGVPPPQYGAPPPKPVAMHFLYTQLRRKVFIERRLAQELAGKLVSDRRPMGRNALTTEAILSRLAQIAETAG